MTIGGAKLGPPTHTGEDIMRLEEPEAALVAMEVMPPLVSIILAPLKLEIKMEK